jgi:hypothetical protein
MTATNNETRNENSQITDTTLSVQDDLLKRLSAIIDVAEHKLTNGRVEDKVVEKAQLDWAQVELRAIQLCRGVLKDREESIAAKDKHQPINQIVIHAPSVAPEDDEE